MLWIELENLIKKMSIDEKNQEVKVCFQDLAFKTLDIENSMDINVKKENGINYIRLENS